MGMGAVFAGHEKRGRNMMTTRPWKH